MEPVDPTPTLNPPRLPTAGQGGSLREVFLLAYPVILTQISVTLMQLVDSAMVGRLGPSELGAVGFGGIWMWTAISLFMGTATAVQTFVSQDHGAGRAHLCGSWAWHGFYAVVPATLVGSLAIFWLSPHLVSAVGPSDALRPLATDYLQSRSLGSTGLIAGAVITAFFRGLGDTRTPLYCTILAVAFNAVLDYGLIFGEFGLPAWGVYGAGFATSASEWFQFACLLAFVSRTKIHHHFDTRPRTPSWAPARRLLRTGLPIGGQWCLEMTSFAAFSAIVVRMGDASMAATQALLVVLSLSFMQAVAISISVATLVGRYIGAGDLVSATRSYWTGMKLVSGLAIAFAILFLSIPGPLIRIFTDDTQVLALTGPLLLMAAGFQVFDAFGIVTDGGLRGAGDTLWPFVVRFVMAWCVQVPLAYGLGITLGGGLTWAWVGSMIYVAATAAILVGRFRSGAWRSMQI